MRYIAALDYEHLDNGMFLTAFARSLSQQQNVQPVIIHGESKYTERIIQTGVMREEARLRSIKDLNHRLVALFADQGVSTVGINGYQRGLITLSGGSLRLDQDYFSRLPHPSVLLISSLVRNTDTGRITPVSLPDLARLLQSSLDDAELFIFSSSGSDELFTKEKKPAAMRWDSLDDTFAERYIPREFHGYGRPLRLTTAREFHQIPALEQTSFIQ